VRQRDDGQTCITDGELRLRIDSRADGRPWEVDPSSLETGLAKAARLIAAY
jgi:hypothetical protein